MSKKFRLLKPVYEIEDSTEGPEETKFALVKYVRGEQVSVSYYKTKQSAETIKKVSESYGRTEMEWY